MREALYVFSEVYRDRAGRPTHGGIQRFARNLVRASRELTAEGWRISVLSLMDAPDRADEQPGSEMTFVGFGGARLRMAAALAPRLRACGSADPVVLLGGVNLAPLLPVIRLLRPRAHVCMMLYGFEVFSPLAAWRRCLLRRLDSFWAISDYTRRRFGEVQGVARQAEVIHLAIEPEWMQAAAGRREGDPADGPRFLCVSRMRPHDAGKRLDLLLRAFAAARPRLTGARLTLVGDGPLRADFERMADGLGIGGSVRFAGDVTEKALREHYRGSDVFVLPSTKEGFGLVFLEAMAHGLPCIGARATSVPEILAHDRTGLLAEPDDADSLAAQLIRLGESAELRARIGEAGRRELTERFGFERFTRDVRVFLEGRSECAR